MPTNIVVSKYNTATGGVSTFRQSNSRSIAKKKDTQRTVELAPGSLGQGDSAKLATSPELAAGQEGSREGVLLIVNSKEPNVMIREGVASAESSPSKKAAKPNTKIMSKAGNPSLDPIHAKRQ